MNHKIIKAQNECYSRFSLTNASSGKNSKNVVRMKERFSSCYSKEALSKQTELNTSKIS